jgi:hypothetical protein
LKLKFEISFFILEEKNMEERYQAAIRTLMEGFHAQEINPKAISDYLVENVRVGLRGYLLHPPRNNRAEPVKEEYEFVGWETYKQFANNLGLAYSEFLRAFDDENNWVNTDTMAECLNISSRSFARFKKGAKFQNGVHIRNLYGRSIEFHKKNVLELYHKTH